MQHWYKRLMVLMAVTAVVGCVPVGAVETKVAPETVKAVKTVEKTEAQVQAENEDITKMDAQSLVRAAVERALQSEDLGPLGTTFTMNDTKPLGWVSREGCIGPFQLGTQFQRPALYSAVKSVEKQGDFTVYTLDHAKITVYSGKDRRHDMMRSYSYAPNDIAMITVFKDVEPPAVTATTTEKDNTESATMTDTNKETVDPKVTEKEVTATTDDVLATWNTARDIHVGSTRGDVVYAYGAPQALFYNHKTDQYVLLYASAYDRKYRHEYAKKSYDVKQDNGPFIKNTKVYDSERGYETGSSSIVLMFSLNKNKVERIDMIEGQSWPLHTIPGVNFHYYLANTLDDEDFVLSGLRVNDYFVNDPNHSWRIQGESKGDSIIGYKDYVVAYDKNNRISHVYLRPYTPTRRGLAVNDTVYLMLYLYGLPNEVVKAKQDRTIYVYKNPNQRNDYLLIRVNDKDHFIESIVLSDRIATI